MAKGKLKSILIKMMSGAGTGFFYVRPLTAFCAPLPSERATHNPGQQRPAPADVQLRDLAWGGGRGAGKGIWMGLNRQTIAGRGWIGAAGGVFAARQGQGAGGL